MNREPVKVWANIGTACAVLCIVAAPCFVIFALTHRVDWQGWGGLALIGLAVYTMQGVLVVSIVGTICGIVGAIRREQRKAVAVSLWMNVGVIVCLGVVFCFTFVLPTAKMKRDRQMERERYLMTRTPEQSLCDAIGHGQLEEVKRLLEGGVSGNATNSEGRRALHIAALYGTPEILSCLLAHGATDNPESPIALHIAAGFGNIEMLKILVEHGWDPSLRLDYYLNGAFVSPADCAISASRTGRDKSAEIQYLESLVVDRKKPEQTLAPVSGTRGTPAAYAPDAPGIPER